MKISSIKYRDGMFSKTEKQFWSDKINFSRVNLDLDFCKVKYQ